MGRSHGTGCLYVKHGSYYARWRTPDGRQVNRRIGPVRKKGTSDGLTRTTAEAVLRKNIELESIPCPTEVVPVERPPTVDEVADELRERLALEGARLSYRQNC